MRSLLRSSLRALATAHQTRPLLSSLRDLLSRAGILLWLACPAILRAQTSLLPADPTLSYVYFDSEPGGSIQRVPAAGQPFTHALRITTASAGENFWSAQCGWNTAQPLAPGDLLALEFHARRIAPLDGKPIDAVVSVEQDGGDYSKIVVSSLPADSPTWRRFVLPLRAQATFPAGPARLAFQFSTGAQTFEVGGVRLLRYPAGTDPRTLPSAFPYAGSEPDAPWRAAAQERIIRHRTRAMIVEVVDAAGQPVRGASVSVEQTRQAFKFGSAIAADRLVEDSPDGDRYRKAFLENFNAAVVENHLKWPFFEAWDRSQTDGALAWLRERKIPTRGHNLIWPSAQNMPSDVPALAPPAMRTRIDNHFDAVLAYTRGDLYEWDVVNEPYDNFLVQGRIPGVPGVAPSAGVLGNDEILRWFSRARERAPGVGLALNDYGVWEGIDQRHRDYTVKYAGWLKDRGAPVTRLGLQGHFAQIILPIPVLLERLEAIKGAGLPLAVTEFDTDTIDERLQAEYLRDVLTIVYADPAFDQFMLWGFWEGAHWIPNGAFYRQDWSPKPVQGVWQSLVRGAWWTSEQRTSDAGGRAEVRAHLGEHRVRVQDGAGRSASVDVKLPAGDKPARVRVTVR
jgi:GH35 family endo-1,4-beta-xylanase